MMVPVQLHHSTQVDCVRGWDLSHGQLSPEWGTKKCWGGLDPPLCPPSSGLLLGLGISITSGTSPWPCLGVHSQVLDELGQGTPSLFILRQASLKGCVLPEETFIIEKV